MQQPGAVAAQASAAAAAPLDLAAAIAGFAADPSRSALELPKALTAEQRKQAKRLADQHGGLKCESFGFGAERQLHLFKKEANEPAVRVKNTFIDDWVVSEAAADEPPHCRSMPTGIFTRMPEREQATVSLSPVVEGSPRESTSAGDSSTMAQSCPGTDFGFAAVLPELPELPEGLRYTVRDTFIHIEADPVAERRAVQSMPDGSFLRYLEAERAAACQAALPSVQAAAPEPPAEEEPAVEAYSVGAEVVIDGLSRLPDFNGRAGVVQSYDANTGRYNVLLEAPIGAASRKMAKVKFENLRPRLPPPPPYFAPTLLAQQGFLAAGLGGHRGGAALECYAAAAAGEGRMTAKPLKLDGLV